MKPPSLIKNYYGEASIVTTLWKHVFAQIGHLTRLLAVAVCSVPLVFSWSDGENALEPATILDYVARRLQEADADQARVRWLMDEFTSELRGVRRSMEVLLV